MIKILLSFVMLVGLMGPRLHATPTVNTSTKGSLTVAEITLQNAGELSDALLDSKLSGGFQYLHLSTYDGVNLNEDDLAALATVKAQTIEMQHVKGTKAFTFSNSNVQYFILPYNWTKDEVKTFANANNTSANFKACLSTSNTENSGDATLVAYLRQANTLADALDQTYYSTNDYKTLGSGSGDCSRLRNLVVMGNICARDISRIGYYDDGGHYIINGVADENNSTWNKNTAGGDLYTTPGSVGNGATDGALKGNYSLFTIDLKDALLADQYCTDIVVCYNGIPATDLKEFWMPEDPNFKTIPADFLNTTSAMHQICIPGNIKNIKTRAFAGTGTRINYIWTTGSNPDVIYDNGATFVTGSGDNLTRTQKYKVGYETEDEDITIEMFDENDDNAFTYGTITLPAGLELIERYAFMTSTSVSDVYVLNTTAPECHVDAFNATMYHANNTVHDENIIEEDGMKIITREAYNNGIDKPMTILHYPRETTTPDLQRYTDPTREYSIATGERDGKGNMIYYPTQTEFEVAYWQATFGYVWKAWNIDRTWYNQEIMLGTGRGWYGDGIGSNGHDSEGGQGKANQFYLDNPNTDKTDRSYYDVRLGDTNQPTLNQPAGLTYYYDNPLWEGYQLYPKPVTVGVTDENGNPVYETVEVHDANGNLVYEELGEDATYEGNYVKYETQEYQEATDGQYCHRLIQDDNGTYTVQYSYTENKTGIWCKAPWDSSVWTTWEEYMGNVQRYDRNVSGFIKFSDQWGMPRFNISDDYVEYANYNGDYSEFKEALTRYNTVTVDAYREATSVDEAPFYQVKTEEVQAVNITKYNDYRGWHQFVLTGYSYNDVTPMEPLRFFIKDNDWWTICEPYDLTYSEMIDFFGTNRQGFDKQIPYLSKLMYVVRDVEKNKITLTFSKNLMEYKEQFLADNGTNTTERVHGIVDDETKWTAEELAKDPVILHAGVPYLIRPNMFMEEGKAVRQFDIFKSENPELYARLNAASELSAGKQADLIYNGEYTVPAYVVGYDAEDASAENLDSDGELVVTMKDGTTITYQDSQKDANNTILYGGKQVKYRISDDYKYSFVGTFYKSLIPQYSYFLGWDSKNKCAAFWYSDTQDKTGWNWNNETGIIIPNFNTDWTIDPASSMNDPARWILADDKGSQVSPDDFPGTQNAKSYSMEFGGSNLFDGVDTNAIIAVEKTSEAASQSAAIYSVSGSYIGTSSKGLAKGVYIRNGKKIVVK